MADAAQQLCLDCGLCCNGVIFADGQLQPGDDTERLRALGLRLKAVRGKTKAQKFSQPCSAFKNCRCAIYSQRPEYCRAFECALLKRVMSAAISVTAATRRIRNAKKRVEKVRALLQELGCHDEHLPLGTRFRRMNERIHHAAIDEVRAQRFGELTLAIHDLNVILAREFYP